ncbi:PREDICTED: 5-hydroxytryptamine receptor 7-like, partial [Tauraco erythrolophus]|uniref:5-hydroxytryptamine receptor 7-like n=1 Tax=Tauraco erythrolophus TaxID=121530 RepID=UPI00052333BE
MVNVLYAVLHSLLSCLIPPANLLVILAVYQLMRRQPGTSYVYILNLATADLLVGVMSVVEALDDIFDGAFDYSKCFCLLRIAMSMTPCIGSILTLLLISLDRYLAVTLPLSYPTLLKKTPIVLSLVVLWMLAFLFGHLPVILPSLQRGNYTGSCGLLHVAKSEYLYVICFGVFAPSLLVLVCLYVSALRTVLLVIVGFSLTWGPYLVGGTVLASPLLDALFLLGETNSLVNPLIYALYSRDIRSHLAKLLQCR